MNTPFIIFFYSTAIILYLIAIFITILRIRKEKHYSLAFLFILISHIFFTLSIVLNSLDALLDTPVTQGISHALGVSFIFCATLTFFYTEHND